MKLGNKSSIGCVMLLMIAASSAAQQAATPQPITLDVVVRAKNGAAIRGLQAQNFSVEDNHQAVSLTGAKEVTDQTVHVLIVLDGENMRYETAARTKEMLAKYMRGKESAEGTLPQPTTVAYFSNRKIIGDLHFSNNTGEVAAQVDKIKLQLRTTNLATGIDGDLVRAQDSFNMMQDLVDRLAAMPGRKALVWISPGWPLLNLQEVQQQITYKMQQKLYRSIAGVQTEMRQSHVVLYSVNPVGAAQGAISSLQYLGFLDEVSKPEKVRIGDLGVQVMAAESGGEVLDSGNELAPMLQQCYADTKDFYVLSYLPLAADTAPFHKVTTKVDRKGAEVFAPMEYYAQQ